MAQKRTMETVVERDHRVAMAGRPLRGTRLTWQRRWRVWLMQEVAPRVVAGVIALEIMHLLGVITIGGC